MRAWPTCLLALVIAASAHGQEPTEEEAAAKQSENPISDILNFKLENSTSFSIGPNDRTQNVLVLQPTVPFRVGSRMSLIAIPRVPLVWQPDLASPTGGSFGLGDISMNVLLGPERPATLVFWGLGPAVRFPTATSRGLGPFDSGQLSLGPAASLVATPGHFVVGFIVNNVWSVAGREGASAVNAFVLQPLLNLNLPSGWYLASTPYIIGDWTVPEGNGWLVPVGAGLGKITLLSPTLALGVEAHAYWNAIRPDFGPPWSLRIQASLTFPKRQPRPPSSP